jgi:drug/metabolite transporter (DMT)-like permease
MKPITKAYVFIHIAVLLWGITAILGKLISYNEYILVWIRMVLVSASFLFFKKTYEGLKAIKKSEAIRIGLNGILVAVHWIFFYGAIKYSNVSITLSILATISLMTSFLEPLITKRKFQWYESLLGFTVIPGIYLIFFYTEASYFTGMMMAFACAFFAAIFTSYNKKYVEFTNPYTFSFIQISTGLLFISIGLPIYLKHFPEAWYVGSQLDFIYLFILSFLCTTIPFVLSLIALKQLNAFTTNLITNLEPVYGIILAAIIFKENQNMDVRFYIGASIVITSVFLQPFLRRRLI